ncbi:MAG: DUF2203 domain-containing protein [Sporichthyaceae bacterium]
MNFTITQARTALIELMPTIAEFIAVRADAAEFGTGRDRLNELMRDIQASGADVKGFAPLLLDFAAQYEGETVLLCWLEGDLGLAWYHRPDLGFAGRRPLPFDA